jgi:hypothetical protein
MRVDHAWLIVSLLLLSLLPFTLIIYAFYVSKEFLCVEKPAHKRNHVAPLITYRHFLRQDMDIQYHLAHQNAESDGV